MRRERHWALALVSAALSLVLTLTAAAQTPNYIFTPIDVRPFSPSRLLFTGINNAGQIVGYNEDDNHGLFYSGGNLTEMDLPAYGINNIGQIPVTGGFLNSDGSFTPIGSPPIPFCCTAAYGINDMSQIVGSLLYWNGIDISAYHGFLYSAGNFTIIDAPGADPWYGNTYPQGINNAGQIVGYFDAAGYGGREYGYLLDTDGSYTTIDPPGSSDTWVYGINNAGQIVGTFYDSQSGHGFLYVGGGVTLIDVPGALFTNAFAVNDGGQIVLRSVDSTSRYQWFVATPAQSPGLARLLGGPSTNQANTLMGGSHVFTSPAKSSR